MNSIKKFSQIRRFNEADEATDTTPEVKPNLPENIEAPEAEKPKEDEKKEEGGESPKALFSKIFESKEMARVYHLQVKGDEGSYATHMAMGAYYEELPDLIDSLVEQYQGQYDLVEGYEIINTTETSQKSPIDYFKGVAEFIKKERKSISDEDSHLQNVIDEIVGLVYQTLYRLRYNR